VGEHAQTLVADASDPGAWWDGVPFDAILLDAPCSATGVIRRQPDVMFHRRAEDIDALVGVQARLLEACWSMLRPGGVLLYATCSILRAENIDQVRGVPEVASGRGGAAAGRCIRRGLRRRGTPATAG
jgi:16S rRNA (cytosine967-C5)-methyltransferase